MNPQEIQKQNLEAIKTKESINENNKSKDKLQKIIEKSNLKVETIENLKKILALLNINELNDFIISEPDLDDVVNNGKDIDLSLSLEGIIDNFLMKFGEAKTDKVAQEKIKKGNFDSKNGEISLDTVKQENVVDDTDKEKKLTQNEGLELINKNTQKYKDIFKDNNEFLSILSDLETNKLNQEKLNKESIPRLENFLSKPENRKAVFDKLATNGDEKLYKETYQAFSSLSTTIKSHLSDIPSTIYKVEKLDKSKFEDKSIISQFPNAKPEDIEKRGNLVSYQDKTIDLKTGKAYISGEKGYAIETSMQVPNSLDLRVEYQKQRLEKLEDIKINENILVQIEEYKNTLKYEKKLKEEYDELNLGDSDINKTLRKKEIESQLILIIKYQKLTEERFPEINKPEQFEEKIKEKIDESKKSLKSLKEKFEEKMQELLEVGKDEIIKRDEKTKETLKFLDDLGITNINQNDLQQIINRININPLTYGFSKKIDLKSGFSGSATESHKQKKEFFKLFSKIYEKMNFNPPVNESIVEGFTKDARLKEDTIFKEKLENIGVTRGGSLQIETFMEMVKPSSIDKKESKSEN